MRALAALAWILPSFLCAAGMPAAAQTALDRAARPVVQPEKDNPVPSDGKHPTVQVEVRPQAAAVSGPPIAVGAIVISGLRAMSPVDFADLLASRVGQTLDPSSLRQLTSDIAARARRRGYVFASAWIEPQQISAGVLTVNIDEGVITGIRIDGVDHAGVRAALQPLLNGKPVTANAVERRLLIAGDIDGVYVRGSRFVRENGSGVLVVQVSTDRVRARAIVSNDSTRTVGPEQLRLEVDMSALFSSADALTVTYSATPAEPRELQYVRARYRTRISSTGTEVGLTGSFSTSNPGAYLEPYDIRSRSWFAGANLLHPLWRRRDTSIWLEGEIGVRDLEQRRRGTLVRHDRIVAARLGVYGYTDLIGGRLRVNATASQGLGILGATRAGDTLASRWDADGAFSEFTGWADWTASVGGKWSVRIAAQSQLASRPLLVAEEAGLGGAAFLRGYDYSERSGDQGLMASGELRYDWKPPLNMARKIQLYTFLDGGRVTNLRGGYGSGSLASTGGGFRADLTRRLDVNLELALPLSGARYDTGDRTPRINFKVLRTF